jgi:hypothetical protein
MRQLLTQCLVTNREPKGIQGIVGSPMLYTYFSDFSTLVDILN